ncbi:MAG: putative lipid II flippase FtsW [Alphaproteobacteria bacterium MarineAlpha2_Bin1]|nr:MAG: putative lipid II flippase FtsW [Alphaproteobacteria bacterium MarineAlpha2_Bin1]|tara:strand:+ start:1747 stop:2892 length:1146 start_codon:yes stop_codon:yes gene_type:complete
MINLGRTDRSIIGHWWWTVDRLFLVTVFSLMFIGVILIMASSPAVADRIGFESFHFVRRQLYFIFPSIFIMLSVSLLSPLWIRRVGVACFCLFLMLFFLTLLVGYETKGAQRWLQFGSLLLQPSEFIKPTLVIFTAWMLSEKMSDRTFPGYTITIGVTLLILTILYLQPDIGMAMVISAVMFVQMFIAGLSIYFVILFSIIGMIIAFCSYLFFPHVTSRVDSFLDPKSGDSYQVDAALNAFDNGGLLGTGPGEGVVKEILPDAHADFIFAVAGEEFGIILVLIIIVLFAFLVLRGFSKILNETNSFIFLTTSGILTQIGLQAVINMGVNMRLLPAKGMTLPFISYGGSSLLALSFGIGVVIALTRKRVNLKFSKSIIEGVH